MTQVLRLRQPAWNAHRLHPARDLQKAGPPVPIPAPFICLTRSSAAQAHQRPTRLMQFATRGCRVQLIVWFFAAYLLAPAALFGQQAYRIGPPGAWITPLQPDLARPAPTENLSEGYELLLF